MNQQLQNFGLDLQRLLNVAFTLLGVPPTTSTTRAVRDVASSLGTSLGTVASVLGTIVSGLGTYLSNIYNIISTSLIKMVMSMQYLISPTFRAFVQTVTNPDFVTSAKAILATPEAVALITDAEQHGVNTDAIITFVHQLGADALTILKDVQTAMPRSFF